MTRQASRLEDRGVQNLTSRQEHLDERETHQPAAPAYDRRHDGAQLRREDAQRLYPTGQDLHSFPQPFAGYGDSGGSSPLPAASDPDRRPSAEHQRLGSGLAFFFTAK